VLNRPLWLQAYMALTRLRQEKGWRAVREQHGPEMASLMRKRITKAERITRRAISDNLLYGTSYASFRLGSVTDADGN
jgi:hypothetical protein